MSSYGRVDELAWLVPGGLVLLADGDLGGEYDAFSLQVINAGLSNSTVGQPTHAPSARKIYFLAKACFVGTVECSIYRLISIHYKIITSRVNGS